ncbi:MAG: hypothetical protein AAGH38_00295 [Pseudomonadota bacterium]
MEVKSALADIEFYVGEAQRDGDRLRFSSARSSSLEATVYLSPRDVAALLWSILRSPSALAFALAWPWLWLRGGGRQSGRIGGDTEHPFNNLNRPW